jgi:hypothetical protein
MKQRIAVAVATVQGKAYFLIVKALQEQNISFFSLIPGKVIPSRVKVVITTEKEKPKVLYDKILIFREENEREPLMVEVKKRLLDKEDWEQIIVGIDPGELIGLAVIADGKVIEENNCYSNRYLGSNILKVLKSVNFSVTNASIKIGNGVPVYRER